MCLLTMTQAGRERVTQCISLVHADVLCIAPQRTNNSTFNQLSFMYHEFCKALDEKKKFQIAFCDISKAFDKSLASRPVI